MIVLFWVYSKMFEIRIPRSLLLSDNIIDE